MIIVKRDSHLILHFCQMDIIMEINTMFNLEFDFITPLFPYFLKEFYG